MTTENRLGASALRELLVARGGDAEEHLECFWGQLSTPTPLVCWYPSAGSCFRDLMVWRHWLGRDPDIVIHTDYLPTALPEGPILHEDRHTKVRLIRTSELYIDPSILYHVNNDFVDFADQVAPGPRVRLIDIELESDICGEIRRPLLYFQFENLNWFEEFVLKRGLRISHLFKLREGCGLGGNRKSVSVVYGFLGLLGCRFLLCDQEAHFDWDLFNTYACRYAGPAHTAFAVRDLGKKGALSGFEMKAFSVEALSRSCSVDHVREALRTITRGSAWDVERR